MSVEPLLTVKYGQGEAIMTISGTTLIGIIIIVLQTAITILQYIIHQQQTTMLAELRAMKPTVQNFQQGANQPQQHL